MRMAETIVAADRDDGDFWRYRLQPSFTGRAIAAMMSDFQDVALQIQTAGQYIIFS